MNIKEVALLAETSVATVSRVMNNDPKVSSETRQRVQEVVKSTGYKPNLIGRNLRTMKSGKILVLMPTISNPHYSKVLQGIEDRAAAKGYESLFAITHRNSQREKRYVDLILTRQVDGIIAISSTLNTCEMNDIAGKLPFIQCGAYTLGKNISYVCIDNITATYDAINHFINTGNTKIAFINGQFSRTYEQERDDGYKKALTEAGIGFNPEYLVHCDYSHKDGYKACKELMALSEPPTAILNSSDQLAAGVVKYLLESNIKPRDDVEVFGFDNTFISEMCYPSLSSVAQPGYEIGKTSVDLLLEKIDDINSVSKGIVMRHALVNRDTTKKLETDEQ